MSEKSKVICIVGPTASGKTSLSVELAKKLNGEIICADSMQIYEGITVASAAPSEEEKCGIPHHLFEFLEKGSEFCVADYVNLAREKISEIISRGKQPIVVGGTGLYINALADNILYTEQKYDSGIRGELEKECEQKGSEYMLEKLKKIDSLAAQDLHPNNTRRILRAIEIYYTTGLTKTEQNELSKRQENPYGYIMLGVNYSSREALYERINMRVEKMLENGLLEEAKRTYENKSLNKSKGALQAIGHKEFFEFFEGNITYDEAVENLKRSTRRYAKRQLTWFNRDNRINWIYPDITPDVFGEALKIIKEERQ